MWGFARCRFSSPSLIFVGSLIMVGLGGSVDIAPPVLHSANMARGIHQRTPPEDPALPANTEPQPVTPPVLHSATMARGIHQRTPPEDPALPANTEPHRTLVDDPALPANTETQPVMPPPPSPAAVPRDFAGLTAAVGGAAQASGAQVGVALVELGGKDAATWSYFGDAQFLAASTYKLPLLMAEAQGIADGTLTGSDQLCYQDADYQDGYYQDYVTGTCYTRDFLASRVGQQSDNTAAYILVRYLGGADALNTYARAHGAQASSFFDANVTTANDLARLWVSEAGGAAGGQPAQAWLYPLLQNTAYEAGIGAGLSGAIVVHKVGMVDDVVNDAALILSGPRGPYVLIVGTTGVGGSQAWDLIAQISSQVGQVEAARGP